MPQRADVELALTKPRMFGPFGDNKYGWELTSIEGEQYNSYDSALVKAFEEADLAGVKHMFTVSTPDDPQKKPTIIGIPGVYTKSGSGWRGGGGMSDRQVALLAASSFLPRVGSDQETAEPMEVLYAVAEDLEKWLVKTSGGGGEQGASDNSPAEATEASAAPAPTVADVTTLDGLKELAGKIWPDNDNLPDVFLTTQAKRFNKKLDALAEAEIAEIGRELQKMLAAKG